jgi:hypothetical protein
MSQYRETGRLSRFWGLHKSKVRDLGCMQEKIIQPLEFMMEYKGEILTDDEE